MQELHIDNEKLYTDFFKRLRHSHSFLVRLLGQGQKPYKMPYFDSMWEVKFSDELMAVQRFWAKFFGEVKGKLRIKYEG